MIKDFHCDCTVCEACYDNVFRGFSHESLEFVNQLKNHFVYKKGDRIFLEGEVPKGLFFIFKGSVKISKSDMEGKELIVRLAKRGDVIGYRALLCNDNYHASAIALEEVYLCFVSKDIYLKLLQKNPDNIFQIIGKLSSDLMKAEERMLHIANMNVEGRIAEILLVLTDFYGCSERSGLIKATLRKEDIGHMVGTTTESAIRVLSVFRRKGLIDFEGKRLRLLNVPALRTLSGRV